LTPQSVELLKKHQNYGKIFSFYS